MTSWRRLASLGEPGARAADVTRRAQQSEQHQARTTSGSSSSSGGGTGARLGQVKVAAVMAAADYGRDYSSFCQALGHTSHNGRPLLPVLLLSGRTLLIVMDTQL